MHLTTSAVQIMFQSEHIEFSIANTYSVGMGENPRNIDYNQSAMRSHLEECFEKEELSPFPPSSVPVKKSRLKHVFVS